MTDITLCGLVYDGGVILGVNRRVTVQDASTKGHTDSSKLYRLSEKIYCCFVDSAVDSQRLRQLLELVETDLELEFFNTEVPVSSAVNTLTQEMHQCQDYQTCAFIIGGVDTTGGPQLFSVFHGSALVRTHAHKFCAKGSALEPAMEILRAGWKENLSEPSGLKLMVTALTAGTLYDLSSGSKVDVIVIRKSGERCEYKVYKHVGEEMSEPLQNYVSGGTT